MDVKRQAVVFECRGKELVGIIDVPARQDGRGVVIVTGGPQYRAGSHRQFVQVAHAIAAAGHAVMRFDYRGMGDAEGDLADFRSCQADIRAAIDAFTAETGVDEVVLWGLCDAASAGLIYGPNDRRVAGLVLLNPWVRTDEGRARAYVKHYYLGRFFSTDFWRKLLSGKVSLTGSLAEFGKNIRSASSRIREDAAVAESAVAADEPVQNFRQHMQRGLARFGGRVLLIQCGDDLTAAEFDDYTSASKAWRKLLRRVERRDLADADHTFSTRPWRNQVENWTTEWLSSW